MSTSAKNHKWTDDEREIVRRDYKGTNASSQKIADRLGVTLFAVNGIASKLGIMRQKSPPWTAKELERLEQLIHHHSIGTLAQMLHRSPNAVKVKAIRLKLKLRLRDDWYTKRDICEIVGENHHKVQHWIDSGALKASYHNDRRPSMKGMAMWHIEAADLKTFITNYSGELLGRNVDIQQIVWLLTDNK